MQTTEHTAARITPFGTIQRSTRPSPFDLIDAPRAADVLPRRSSYEIFALQPALDGPGIAPERRRQAATVSPPGAADVYRLVRGLVRWATRACQGAIAAVSSRRR